MEILDPQWYWDAANTESQLWPVVCVDLDGVLNEYRGWHGYVEDYPVAEGAHAFMLVLYAQFKTVIVFTATTPLSVAVEWLQKNSLDTFVDYITNWKVPASGYIDDRAVCHRGDFFNTLAEVQNFKPHWSG